LPGLEDVPFEDAECEFFTLFLDLITSVFSEIGLGRPWSFRNSPQALHNTCPDSSLLHSGVVEVLQFLHTGAEILVLEVVAPFALTRVVVLAFGCGGLLLMSFCSVILLFCISCLSLVGTCNGGSEETVVSSFGWPVVTGAGA
jgi:hypothetical protein